MGCMPAISQEGKKPNIIFILADDLGYGDVSAMNANSKIKTTNIDRLISQGCRLPMPIQVQLFAHLRDMEYLLGVTIGDLH